ncbi:hypothetical protein [Bacteroides sp. 224]|uniref:hypothetical protein n=1 Tax=Bacteroides sp. 224 TaxID=2302936 RepID=UPI0013D8CBE1|nr:hypothetical protein [Bacteroides sp. 224]NDV65333.1 hypothetical protein [Bacteroides sp. 224]
MRKLEGLEACRNCTSRSFVTGRGLVCKRTNANPVFEGECNDFQLDEALIQNAPLPEEEVSANAFDIEQLKKEQNMPMAVVAGLAACVAGAIVWALISVSSGMQIGYMAVGMGFLVGYAIRLFGKGVTPVFGVLGACMALLGCVLGDYLSIVGYTARDFEMPFFEALREIPMSLVMSSLVENLMSMTALFYGIAIFEGYKLSFRLQIKEGGKI